MAPLLVPRTRTDRKTRTLSGGSSYGAGRTPPSTNFTTSYVESQRKTLDRENLYPFVKKQLAKGGVYAKSVHALSLMDLGWSFYSEATRRRSSMWGFTGGEYARTLNQSWGVGHAGPVMLGACVGDVPFWSLHEIEQQQQIDFGLGGTAISRARPNKPVIDLSVTIGELRSEGFPVLVGSLLPRSKNVFDAFKQGGKEYLNYQFGWRPLLRDVQGLAEVVLSARKRIEQYQRDLDRTIRRRYEFEPVKSTEFYTVDVRQDAGFRPMGGTSLSANPMLTNYTATNSQGSYSRTSTTESWFSGAFRYFNADLDPVLQDLKDFEEHANLLLGTRIDPEVLWNLQPWSWLADWFVNFGDVLGNISAITFDHQVMQYGYIMSTRTSEEEWTTPPLYGMTGNLFTVPKAMSFGIANFRTTTRKLRGSAYPFGFGLDPSTFTMEQWAILASLGITRVK